MSVMFVLIAASLFVALGFLLAFLWAVKSGQFDDRFTPSVRILFDSKKTQNNNETWQATKKGESSNGNGDI